jgi:hypothetical protein
MKSHPPESLPYEQGSAAVVMKSASGQSGASDSLTDTAVTDTAVTDTAVTDTAVTALDSASVEELTNRLPTSELIRIIKGALECGKRNLPFTQTDLLRAMTIPPPAMSGGSGASPELGGRAPRR